MWSSFRLFLTLVFSLCNLERSRQPLLPCRELFICKNKQRFTSFLGKAIISVKQGRNEAGAQYQPIILAGEHLAQDSASSFELLGPATRLPIVA